MMSLRSKSLSLVLLMLPGANSYRVKSQKRQAASRSEATAAQASKFIGEEHKVMGDAVVLSNGIKGSDMFSTPTHGHNVTLGDIITGCGDWYGKSSQPISDVSDLEEQKQRFLTGPWECFDKDEKSPARLLGYKPCTTCTAFSAPSGCNGYILLANNNVDHFAKFEKYSLEEQGGAGAWEAYSAGHRAACETAAGSRTDDALRTGLMQNACAMHYLTDMYASGHIRQARRQFDCFSLPAVSLNCLTSKAFHDEDNVYGLHVSNANGDTWKAYGDNCWNSPKNAQNREVAQRALTASLEAVLQAWKSGSVAACKADTETAGLVINVREVQDPESQARLGNHAPMFIPTTGWGCGYPVGPCNALGDGEITDKYARGDSCNMTDYAIGDYGWYKSEATLLKLNTVCPQDSRGQQFGFEKC